MSLSEYWLNGEKQRFVGIDDRGLLYGDGFFTTILVLDQKVMNWSAHVWRIQQACDKLALPKADLVLISQWLATALQSYFSENNQQSCIAKILMTRGHGGVGYQMPHIIQPNILIYLKPVDIATDNQKLTMNTPVDVGLCTHLASISSLAGIKHLNRLENVMARTEIADAGFAEGIMLNMNQQVISGTQSNIFMVKDSVFYTPELNNSGVEGTTRYQLLNIIQSLGWSVKQQLLTLDDINSADELFFCNAVRGIQPVATFRQQESSLKEFAQNWTQKIHQAWSDYQFNNALSLKDLAVFKVENP